MKIDTKQKYIAIWLPIVLIVAAGIAYSFKDISKFFTSFVMMAGIISIDYVNKFKKKQ